MARGNSPSGESREPLRSSGISLPSFNSGTSFEMEMRDYTVMDRDRENAVVSPVQSHFETQSGPYTSVAQEERDTQDQKIKDASNDGTTSYTTELQSSKDAGFAIRQRTLNKGRGGQRRLKLGRTVAFWMDSWIAEVLSCGVAVLSLIGLTVTLRVFQGKPLADYPLKISLNTIVAVFSAIVKASLLMPVGEAISQLKWLWFSYAQPLLDVVDFDLASRGPWGSILLLIRLNSYHLASIGAWITVLALAIDPFSQQILQFNTCSEIMSDGIAAIPRTYNFTGAATSGFVNGTFLQSFASLDQGASAAIYMGLLDPPKNASSNVQVTCPTGNCTFPFDPSDGATFQNLAWGTSCVEVKDIQNSDTSHAGLVVGAYKIPDYGTGDGAEEMEVTFTDDEMVVLTMNATDSLASTVDGKPYMVHFRILMMNIPFKDCPPEKFDQSPKMLRSCTPKQTPFAAECTIFPKVQTINATIANGVLYEKVIAEERMNNASVFTEHITIDDGAGFPVQYPWVHIANRTLNGGRWADITPADGPSENASVPALPDRLMTEPNWNDDAVKWYPHEGIFAIDESTTASLSQVLTSMFGVPTQQHLQVKWTDNGISYLGEPWILKLYNNGTANISSVEAYFRGLEDSLSAYTRSWGDQGGSKTGFSALGKPWVVQTCIRVRWWWMSFPVVLTLASIVFLGLTYWRTRMDTSGAGSWKSFTLADLFSGLDEGIRGRYGRLDRKSEMQDAAAELRVKLVLTDDGWRLREVDGGREWKVEGGSR